MSCLDCGHEKEGCWQAQLRDTARIAELEAAARPVAEWRNLYIPPELINRITALRHVLENPS